MSKKDAYLLPEVIDPPRVSFCIEIPNELGHIIAFWGQLSELGKYWNWERDATGKQHQIAAVWNDVWDRARDSFDNRSSEGCYEMAVDDCCNETNAILTKILKLLESGMTVNFNGTSEIADFIVDCTPKKFDDGTGSDDVEEKAKRLKALCLTVQRYVAQIMFKVASDFNMSVSVRDILHATPSVEADINFMFGWKPFSVIGISIDDVTKWIEQESWLPVVCALLDGLEGAENTFDNFQNCLDGLDPTGLETCLINLVNYIKINNNRATVFEAFSKELEKSYDLVDAHPEIDCDCELLPPDPCGETPLDIIVYPIGGTNVADMTIENLGSNRWRFTQNTVTPSQEGSYFIAFQDSLGRCIHVEADAGSQAVQLYSVIGCVGAEGDCESADTTGHGGFVPINALAVGQGTTDPTDTVYVITCCVPTP